MTECSKTQIRLTRHNLCIDLQYENVSFVMKQIHFP